jgi:hypothetical protein
VTRLGYKVYDMAFNSLVAAREFWLVQNIQSGSGVPLSLLFDGYLGLFPKG